MKTNRMSVRIVALALIGLVAIPAGLVSCREKTLKTDATGIFESTEVVVSAETGGRLCRLNVEEGDALRVQQEVGLVDTVPLSLKRAGLVSSKSALFHQRTDVPKQVAATRRQIERARIEVDRLRDLVARGAGTQQQLDDAEAQLGVLSRQLEAQLSTLTTGNQSVESRQQATGYQIAEIDDQIRRCHIQVPMDGVVLTKYAEAGEVVGVGTPLFRMADMSRVFLRLMCQVRWSAGLNWARKPWFMPMTGARGTGVMTVVLPGFRIRQNLRPKPFRHVMNGPTWCMP